jgi:hypothetical protein
MKLIGTMLITACIAVILVSAIATAEMAVEAEKNRAVACCSSHDCLKEHHHDAEKK